MANISFLGPTAIASVASFTGVAKAGLSAIGPLTISTGGGTSPGTGSIVAWYDMADASDADGRTFNLGELNSPTYTAGPPSYGTSTDGTPGAYWSQISLDSSFGNTDQDWSFVFRFRALTGIASGDIVFIGNGGRTQITYSTTAIGGRCGGATTISSTVAGVEDTWFTCVVSHNATADTTSFSVNGETFVTGAVTATYNTGNMLFGAATTSNTQPIDLDFAGFWGKQLTQDNVTWLYNSGGTRTYAEL